MNELENKNILLGVCGGIAAYKIADLASRLKKRGANVRVVMTKNATNIINPITFENLTGNRCMVDTFDRNFQFKVEHISLARRTDLVLIAPATANTIAKMRFGIADNLLTSILLATRAPLFVAPAMNNGMWENVATQENVAALRKRGVTVVEPDDGELACGVSGKGRVASPDAIFAAV